MDDDADDRQEGQPRHEGALTRKEGSHPHRQGQSRRDEEDPGGLQLQCVGAELGQQRGIGQGQPGEVSEGEEGDDERCGRPDQGRHAGQTGGLDAPVGARGLGDEEGGHPEQAEGQRRGELRNHPQHGQAPAHQRTRVGDEERVRRPSHQRRNDGAHQTQRHENPRDRSGRQRRAKFSGRHTSSVGSVATWPCTHPPRATSRGSSMRMP